MRPVIEARGSTDIARPVEAVFAYVADARNEPSWLPGAAEVRKTTPGDIGLGTRFEGTYARAGTVTLEIVRYEPPRGLTFRARARPVHFDDEVELAERDGRTHLDARMLAEPQGVLRFLPFLMTPTLRKSFATNWDHLRRELERA
jgi:uncharacterized protein YndB with AHSA1/START domain